MYVGTGKTEELLLAKMLTAPLGPFGCSDSGADPGKNLSDRAIDYAIDLVLKKLEQMIREKSGDQQDLKNELKS